MSLADLIRKKPSMAVATAIPAIPATHGPELAGTVARIATVAVAIPTEAKSDGRNDSKNSNCSSSNRCEQATTYYRWLIHFADRDPLDVAFSPELTHAEVLTWYPLAVAAEPCDLATRLPAASKALIGDGSSWSISTEGNADRSHSLDTQNS